MAIYLKKFENHTQYDNYINGSSAILPNVSICTTEGDVHYNPSTPPTPSYETVDLGLPSGTLWSTMNVGASSITDYGNYYQYGKGAATYQETSGGTWYEGEEVPLAASADTATQVWGSPWHMPTSTQCQELIDNTTYEWTTINGVNGGKFTATNGNYVFFPACGSYSYDGEGDVGYSGSYYSSTSMDSITADALYFTEYSIGIYDYERGRGYSVRPVMDA